jgi:hypothetical protein
MRGGGYHPGVSRKFYNDCTGRMAVESANSVSFRFGAAGKRICKIHLYDRLETLHLRVQAVVK